MVTINYNTIYFTNYLYLPLKGEAVYLQQPWRETLNKEKLEKIKSIKTT